MITNVKSLEKYCTDYTKIENYVEAVKSPFRYDLHHRLEISEKKSLKDLIEESLYYGRPPEELIFLEHGEHMRMHHEGKYASLETRQKMSEVRKGKQYVLGRHWTLSAETKQKISEAKKGHAVSVETKKKMSESRKGRHWHLENGHRIWTD